MPEWALDPVFGHDQFNINCNPKEFGASSFWVMTQVFWYVLIWSLPRHLSTPVTNETIFENDSCFFFSLEL